MFLISFILSPNRRRKLPVWKNGFLFQESEIGGNGGVFPQDRTDCREARGSVGDGGFNNHNMSSMQNPWFIWVVCRELYGTPIIWGFIMDLSWIYHVMNRTVSHGMSLVGLFWANCCAWKTRFFNPEIVSMIPNKVPRLLRQHAKILSSNAAAAWNIHQGYGRFVAMTSTKFAGDVSRYHAGVMFFFTMNIKKNCCT